MTSLLFNIYFYGLTGFMAIIGSPLALLRTSKPLVTWVSWWAKAIRYGMKHIVGITVEIRGREHMPVEKTAIIAAKHHSYVDAVLLIAEMPQVAVVAMKELAKVPFVGLVFKKLGMIMVERGSRNGVRHLADGAAEAIASARPILIYPEGHIPPVGVRVPYKKGVWHLQQAHGLHVVPVATNLGLRWSQNNWQKTAGHAVIEFLPPLRPGLKSGTFMADLENRVESATAVLLEEGGYEPVSSNSGTINHGACPAVAST